jgi:hypothetical protein
MFNPEIRLDSLPMFGGNPQIILHQEKEQQEKLVNSSRLPREMEKEEKAKLIEFGVKFLDPLDDLFYEVVLPEKWEIIPTDHSMWSHLVDQNGIKIGSIFYKGSWYDQSAHFSLTNNS